MMTWGWSWEGCPDWIWLKTWGHAVVATCQSQGSHVLNHILLLLCSVAEQNFLEKVNLHRNDPLKHNMCLLPVQRITKIVTIHPEEARMSSTRSHVKVSRRRKRFWYLMGLIRDPSNIQSYLTETPAVCSKSPTALSHSARHPLGSPQWLYDRQTQWTHESITAELSLKIFNSEPKVMLRLNLKPWIQIVRRFMLQFGFKSTKIFSLKYDRTHRVYLTLISCRTSSVAARRGCFLEGPGSPCRTPSLHAGEKPGDPPDLTGCWWGRAPYWILGSLEGCRSEGSPRSEGTQKNIQQRWDEKHFTGQTTSNKTEKLFSVVQDNKISVFTCSMSQLASNVEGICSDVSVKSVFQSHTSCLSSSLKQCQQGDTPHKDRSQHSIPAFTPFSDFTSGLISQQMALLHRSNSQCGDSDSEAAQRTQFGGFVILFFFPLSSALRHDEPAVDRNVSSLSSSTNASVIKSQRDSLCSDNSLKTLHCFYMTGFSQ